MSSFRVPVVAYSSEAHPNADRLEMAVVGGWRAACPVNQYTDGQKVAYIPEQALLPQELVEEMGLADPPRLAGSKHNRVKPIRLRGELSQGLIYGGPRIADLDIGDDAQETLGIVKWQPPVPVRMGGAPKGGPKIVFEVDNIKTWPDRLVTGEQVVVTEKLHGTFCCLGVTEHGQPVVSSKGLLGKGLRIDPTWDENQKNLYVEAWERHQTSVRRIGDMFDGPVFVFGEIVGPRVQDLTYDQQKPSFYVFDVLTPSGYADWNAVVDITRQVGLTTVPVVYVGPFTPGLLDDYTTGQSTLANHLREGVVIKPTAARYDHGRDHPSGRGPGRVVFKSVNPAYLFRKGGTEHE